MSVTATFCDLFKPDIIEPGNKEKKPVSNKFDWRESKKRIGLTFAFFISLLVAQSQNVDSILSIPQVFELQLSTPQPRLKEKFQISLDINYVRAHIFKSAFGKIKLANNAGNADDGLMTLNVIPTELGKAEIGPLEFTLNGTKYSTNKISYEAIAALPNVDKGLWFRKVITGENKFCIIIEQRIPAKSKTTTGTNNSFTITTEAEYTEIAKFKDSYSIAGLSGSNSRSYTDYSSIYDQNGVEKQFLFGYSIYYFNIEDKNIKIKVTKDKFQNLPADFKFEDIVVQ